MNSVYEVPLTFAEEKVDEIILRHLQSRCQRAARSGALERHAATACRIRADEVDIALVGKYVEYEDSYKSLKEALLHGGIAHNVKVNIHWIEAESFEKGGSNANWSTSTAFWCPAVSASAASKA